MKTYGVIDCPDCGVTITRTSPNTKRCSACALSAHGETKTGYKPKDCSVCGCAYTPTGSTQKVCMNCKDAYHKAKNAGYRRAIRDKAGSPRRGDVLACASCGRSFEYISGPQSRCRACQYDTIVRGIRKWSRQNPEKIKRYRTLANDKYYFGGNRIAALERDGHTCQRCGGTDDLHVHHIDGMGVTTPKKLRNNSLDNLQTLCRSCHSSIHMTERHSS